MGHAPLWGLALLVSLHVANAFTPNYFFNVTLDAVDAALVYGPELYTPNATEVWNISFTGTPWEVYAPGRMGTGTPWRIAQANITAEQLGTNPTVIIQYVGTSIYFFGTTQDTYPTPPGIDYGVALLMDSEVLTNATSTEGVIVSSENDNHGYHSAVFSLNRGAISFEGCNVTVGIETEVESFEEPFNTTESFVVERNAQNSFNNFYAFAGQWEMVTNIGGVGGQDPVYMPHVVGRAGQSLSAKVPANTTFAYLVGLVAPNFGRGLVEWSPNPPFGDRASLFRAHGPWTNPSVLHFATLDPTIEYTVKISALSVPSNEPAALPVEGIGLTDMIFFSSLRDGKLRDKPRTSDTGGPNTAVNDVAESKPPIGAIVGGVVGGILGLAAIAAALFLFVFRKRKNKQKQPPMSEHGVFNVDYDPDIVVPFVPAPVRSETPAGVAGGDVEPHQPSLAAARSSFAAPSVGAYGDKSGYSSSQLMGGAVLSGEPSRTDSGVGSSDAMSQSHSRTSDSKSQLVQRRQSDMSFAQEQDAGAVPQSTMDLIPPSYDESWQQNRPPTS